MAKVLRSKVLGFCMGVKRAVDMAEEVLNENEEKEVFMLGPLIHNEQALQALYDKGLHLLSEEYIEERCNEKSIVIIRAHGTSPSILTRIEKTGARIVDTSCPRVKASQKRAASYSQDGFLVFIAGDLGHGEVLSISSYAGDKAIVFKDAEEAKTFFKTSELFQKNPRAFDKAILISQTTIRKEEYDAIIAVLQKKLPQIEVFNTICSATKERQLFLRELAHEVDGILVIGGRHSANTQRLLSLAQELSPHAALVEAAHEIPPEFFRLEKVGLTAGASTANKSIDEVEQKLFSMNEE